MPVFYYGAQTWTLTEIQIKSLQIIQRGVEKSVLGVKRRNQKEHKEIRERTGYIDAGYTVRRLKIKYVGHVRTDIRKRRNYRTMALTPYGGGEWET